MASLMESPVAPGIGARGRRVGVRRMQKHNTSVDMTPMVDLGFLLIAFFVMTTELNRPSSLDLAMPKDGPPTEVENSNSLTFLLDKDNTVYYYHGEWNEAKANGAILKTTLHSKELGKVIREKQLYLDKAMISTEKRDGLMLMIKPGSEASYGNVIDALDEALIHDIKKYVVLRPSAEESAYLQHPQ
jgi:biopolymer transport protein ExbD